MSFSFSNLMDNMRQGLSERQALPLSQKLMATSQMLHGKTPDWGALIHQYSGGAAPASPESADPAVASPASPLGPLGDVAAQVSAHLGAQSGLSPMLSGLGGALGGKTGFGFGAGGLMSLLGKK